jgi:thiamine pyrophosphokinase
MTHHVPQLHAVIQIIRAATTQAYKYGLKFKNAKGDLDSMHRELGHVKQVLEKLKRLAERTEQSGKPLDTWPTVVALAANKGPLVKCN